MKIFLQHKIGGTREKIRTTKYWNLEKKKKKDDLSGLKKPTLKGQ